MRVRDIMTRSLACCTPETSLKEVARMMVDSDCGAIPVIDDLDHNQPMGIITDRDIVCRVVAEGKNPLEMTAGECMSSPAQTVHPDDTLAACCEVLEENKLRRVLVINDQGCCCGIVSQADVAMNATPWKTAEVVCEVSQPA